MRKGQTIIEAMIGLSILTVGFLGIMTLLSKSFFLSRITSNELTATYLGAEGLELAKNIIDHDVYAPAAVWGTSPVALPTADYELDYTTCTSAAVCAPQPYAGRALRVDPVTHLYGYTASQITPYTRRIRITDVPGSNQITVSVFVTWSTGLLTSQTIDLEDTFYNWHP